MGTFHKIEDEIYAVGLVFSNGLFQIINHNQAVVVNQRLAHKLEE